MLFITYRHSLSTECFLWLVADGYTIYIRSVFTISLHVIKFTVHLKPMLAFQSKVPPFTHVVVVKLWQAKECVCVTFAGAQ